MQDGADGIRSADVAVLTGALPAGVSGDARPDTGPPACARGWTSKNGGAGHETNGGVELSGAAELDVCV